ncbi:uncharacterized protein LOC135848184 isoform X2 [Planococcus citri]|uniref:uncharacterized protein LOC135848184 isoform X2 n=1 Tax=Planococcus citri TaxID=170843 RepID=UPI0031F8EB3A
MSKKLVELGEYVLLKESPCEENDFQSPSTTVHKSWIDPKENSFYWPPGSTVVISNLMANHTPPEPGWAKIPYSKILFHNDRLGTVKKQYADRVGGLVESDGSSDPQKDQPEKKENSSHSRKRKSPFKNSLPSSRGKLMTANCLLPPKLSAKKMTKLSKSTASKNGTFISSKKNRPTVQSATRNLMNLLDDTPTQATSTSEPQTRNSVHDLYDDTHMQGTTSESQKQNSMHGVLNDTPIRSSTRISEYLNDEKSVTKAIRDARHALHGTPFQPEDFLITGPQYENHSLDRTPNYQSENGYANDYNEEQGFHALENSIENLDKQNNSNIVPKDVDATPETVQPHKDDSEQKLKRICNNPISAIQNKLKVGEDPSPTDIGLALVGIHRQNVRTQVLLANLIKIVNSSSDNQQPTIVQPDYGKQFPFTTLQDFEAFNSLLSDSAEKKKFSAYVTAMFSNLNKNNAQSTVYDTTKALFNDFIFEHHQWSSRKSKNEELLNNRLLVFKTTTFAECFFDSIKTFFPEPVYPIIQVVNSITNNAQKDNVYVTKKNYHGEMMYKAWKSRDQVRRRYHGKKV